MRKSFLLVSAAVEIAAGAALILVPSAIVGLLIGGTLDSSAAIAVARIAGAALAILGLICWFASRHPESPTAMGVVTALLFYNATIVGILLYENLGHGLNALGIWPAIIVHVALGIWCLASVRPRAV